MNQFILVMKEVRKIITSNNFESYYPNPSVRVKVKEYFIWYRDVAAKVQDVDKFPFEDLYKAPIDKLMLKPYISKLENYVDEAEKVTDANKLAFIGDLLFIILSCYKNLFMAAIYPVMVNKIKIDDLSKTELGLDSSSLAKIKPALDLLDKGFPAIVGANVSMADLRYLEISIKKILNSEVQ